MARAGKEHVLRKRRRVRKHVVCARQGRELPRGQGLVECATRLKHVDHRDAVGHIPGRQRLIEGMASVEQVIHVGDTGHIPSVQWLVELGAEGEHALHGRCAAHLPVVDVFVEVCESVKDAIETLNQRHIPLPNGHISVPLVEHAAIGQVEVHKVAQLLVVYRFWARRVSSDVDEQPTFFFATLHFHFEQIGHKQARAHLALLYSVSQSVSWLGSQSVIWLVS